MGSGVEEVVSDGKPRRGRKWDQESNIELYLGLCGCLVVESGDSSCIGKRANTGEKKSWI